MATPANLAILTREIERIVSSPYPASLKPLLQVCNHCNHTDLDAWAQQHPDRVFPLAHRLIEGLDIWPSAVDVISHLAVVTEIHNALLLVSPDLLDRLLSSSAKDPSDRLTPVCTAMLSKPLPAEIALPASAMPFLMRLTGNMLSNTSLETVKPVYDLLNTGCLPLRDTFPQEYFTVFEEKVVKYLGRASALDDIDVTLRCLLILSNIQCVTIPPRPSSHTNTLELHQRLPRDIQTVPAYKLLTGERGERTLLICAMAAMNACQMGATLDSAEDRITLCTLVAAKVDSQTRTAFAKKRQNVITKLWSKLSHQSLSSALGLGALAFLNALEPLSSANLAASHQDLIFRLNDWSHISTWCTTTYDVWKSVVRQQTDIISEKSWQDLISSIVFFSMNCPTPSQANRAVETLDLMQELLQSCTTLRTAVMSLASLDSKTSLLQRLCQAMNPTEDHLRDLHSSLTGLFVAAALYSRSQHLHLPATICEHLISKHQSLVKVPARAIPAFDRPVSHLRRLPVSASQRDSRHWRDSVTTIMSRATDEAQQKMLQLFTDAVADMEARCEDAETPLRRMEADRDSLRGERDELSRHLLELGHDLEAAKKDAQSARAGFEEAAERLKGLSTTHDLELRKFEEHMSQLVVDAKHRQSMLEALQLDKQQAEECISAKTEQHRLDTDKLRQQVSLLEAELVTSKRQLGRHAEEQEDLQRELDAKSNELDTHVELITELEGHLKETTEQAEASLALAKEESHTRELKLLNDLATRDDDMKEHERRSGCIQRKFTDAIGRLELADQARVRLEDELNANTKAQAELQSHLNDASRAIEDEQQKLKSTTAGFAEQLAEKDLELRRLREGHNEASRLFAEQTSEACQEFERQLNAMRADADLAANQHAQQMAKSGHSIAGLRKELQKLDRKCREKEGQLERAAEMRTILQQALNMDSERQSMGTSANTALVESQLSQLHQDDARGVSEDETESVVSNSPAKNARTVQQPFKVPSRQGVSDSFPASRPTSQRRAPARRALEDKSPNKKLVTLETPVASKQHSKPASPTRLSTLRRSRRSRGGVAQENDPVVDLMSGLDENIFDDDDDDDDTCSA